MNQDSFPYIIFYVSLLKCNTLYIYMLISIIDIIFACIGMKKSAKSIIQQHNSGVGYSSTESSHLCPYTIFAYICDFSGRNYLLFCVERSWKE